MSVSASISAASFIVCLLGADKIVRAHAENVASQPLEKFLQRNIKTERQQLQVPQPDFLLAEFYI